MTKHAILPIALFFVYAATAQAQTPLLQHAAGSQEAEISHEAGRSFLHTYSPKEYREHAQNWAVVQDDRGVIYAGNGNGLLEYDGATWRLIDTGETIVRSLARDAQGTIYAGTYGDFGVIAPNSVGQAQFVSLRDTLEVETAPVMDVWRTHATSDAVYFQTFSTLFRYADGHFKSWTKEPAFFLSGVVHDTLYVEQRNVGLLKVVGDSIQVIEASTPWAPLIMFGIAAYDDETVLVASGNHGLLRYDGRTMTRFETEADAFLKRHRLSSMTALPHGLFALGTYGGGVVIIDRQGRIREIVNSATGLQDDDVKFLYPDAQGGLWLACNVGLTRVQTPSPLSYYTETQGLKGMSVALARHRQTLYVATTQGVFRMVDQKRTVDAPLPSFKPVQGIAVQAFDLLEAGPTVLVGTNLGVYEIRGDVASRVEGITEPGFILHRSRRDAKRVYVGSKDGVAVLQREGRHWVYVGHLEGVKEEIRSIAEEDDGTLWLGTWFQGVLRAKLAGLDEGRSLRPG